MTYLNKLKGKKIVYKKIKLTSFVKGINSDVDENILGFENSSLTYNFHYKNGALKTGYGVKKMQMPITNANGTTIRDMVFPTGVKFVGAWRYNYVTQAGQKQYMIAYYGNNNCLYWSKVFSSDYNVYKLYETALNAKPTVLNYRLFNRNILIFTSPDDNMLVWNGDLIPYIVEGAPKIKSMCLHNDRLFAIVNNDRYNIWYSSNLNPTDWTITGEADGAGKIELADEQGELNKIISFMGYMFIFRDFGITKLGFYDDSNYSLSQIYLSGSRIYPQTISICANKLFFLGFDGIYMFDGVKATKIDLNIDCMLDGVDNTNATSCYHNGKYFLACKLNFNDQKTILDEQNSNYINNCLLAVDVVSGEFTITRGIDICHMLELNEENLSKLLLCLNGTKGSVVAELTEDGMYFNDIMPKMWRYAKTDMGEGDKNKLLKEVYIKSKHDAKLTITTEKVVKVYNVVGSEDIIRLPIKIKAKQFQFDIESQTSQSYISSPEIIIGLV